ncbi:hypothetical protein B0H34DRAFT_541384 [Crassisporium funariophilum]|nr:hypothetical protein B0H34DRAFT_541384 [Crassisporium funariophilum]
MLSYTKDESPVKRISFGQQLGFEQELASMGSPLTGADIVQIEPDQASQSVLMPSEYYPTFSTAFDVMDTTVDLHPATRTFVTDTEEPILDPLDLEESSAPLIIRETLSDGATAVTSVSDTGKGLHTRFEYPESSPFSPSSSSVIGTSLSLSAHGDAIHATAAPTRTDLGEGMFALTSPSNTGKGLHTRFGYSDSGGSHSSSKSIETAPVNAKIADTAVSNLTAGPVDAKIANNAVHAPTPVDTSVPPTASSLDEYGRIRRLRRRTGRYLRKLPSVKKNTGLNRPRTLRSAALSPCVPPLSLVQPSIPFQVTSESITADAITASREDHSKDDGYSSDCSTYAQAGSPPPDPNAVDPFEDWELEYVDDPLLVAPATPCQEVPVIEAGSASSQTSRGTKRSRDSENDEEENIRPSRRPRRSLTDTPPTRASTMPRTVSLAVSTTPSRTGNGKKRARDSDEDEEEVSRPTRRLRSFTGSPRAPTSTNRPLMSPSMMSEHSTTSSRSPSSSASQSSSSVPCRRSPRLMKKAKEGSKKK